MAKAKINPAELQTFEREEYVPAHYKTVVEEKWTEQTVTLELSMDEAQYLRAIVGSHVYGEGPLRRLNKSIYNAFYDIGIVGGRITGGVGNIHLRDRSRVE